MQGTCNNMSEAIKIYIWNFIDSAEAAYVTTSELFLEIEKL